MSFPASSPRKQSYYLRPLPPGDAHKVKALPYAGISGPADGRVFLGDDSGGKFADAIAVMRKG
ncbi:hypothetical protein [Bradyrhizobium sp. NC92]|uniref:hypothetical protein n=1 Tax=Bradyrhizobium sp. (strain NC92) TaxID=55395 RepID=UPI0021AA1E15|nr:hypothetical protein [Bradyrhizobium sp. NC92]UWU69287.1 hypothetical protein N2602_01765 [Bradyrhizobium sp. NC92]